ncbi:MAG: hypothetical protein OD918_02880 [Gammaproteobacteria bacterium]
MKSVTDTATDTAATTAAAVTREMLSKPRLVTLDSLALVDVGGDDAQGFLQGQFCNDVDDAQAGHAQLNAYCNPKGRVLAVLRLVRHARGFWLVMPAKLADGLIARLKMFVLRAKVDIAKSPLQLLGVMNHGDAMDVDDVGDADEIARAHLDTVDIASRQIFIGKPDALAQVAIGVTAEPTDEIWRLADILAGLPQIYAPTAGAFIPQTINLDLTGGLSFTKGCYPGQEIVARLRYRGKVKQRMLAAYAPGAAAPPPGAPLYAADSEQKIGQVVDAVECAGGCMLSASMRTGMPADGALCLQPQSGAHAALTRIDLPYPLTESPQT